MSSNKNGGKAPEKTEETKDSFINKWAEDGVENPQGLALAGAGFVFIAAIPVTSFLAQPNSLVERAVNALCSAMAFIGSAGASTEVAQSSKIAALSTCYLAMTYAFSGAASAAGVNAAHKEGRDNNHPRAQVHGLRGLPLRLHSAHYHLMEKLPGFVLSAALAQAMAPTDQTIINLLGMHVIAKVFVHFPAYVANLAVPRSLGHVFATASVINVALMLSKRA